ncbi:unnamed protein product, partial [marine sediment metagenome]
MKRISLTLTAFILAAALPAESLALGLGGGRSGGRSSS